MAITIEKISYQNKKDARILEAVLTNWFKDPKELNLTSPNMSYPFKFKKAPPSSGVFCLWTFRIGGVLYYLYEEISNCINSYTTFVLGWM